MPRLRNMKMNGKRRKKYTPRQCALSEEAINKIAVILTTRYFTLAEIRKIAEPYGYKGDPYNLLLYMEARDHLLSQEEKKTKYGMKYFYRIMTKEIYEKIEEEHRENAKRRLLAAISY